MGGERFGRNRLKNPSGKFARAFQGLSDSFGGLGAALGRRDLESLAARPWRSAIRPRSFRSWRLGPHQTGQFFWKVRELADSIISRTRENSAKSGNLVLGPEIITLATSKSSTRLRS